MQYIETIGVRVLVTAIEAILAGTLLGGRLAIVRKVQIRLGFKDTRKERATPNYTAHP